MINFSTLYATFGGVIRDVASGVSANGIDMAANSIDPGNAVGELIGAAAGTAAAEMYLGGIAGPSAAGAFGGAAGTFVGGLAGELLTFEKPNFQGLLNDALGGALAGAGGGWLGGTAARRSG